MRDVNSFDRNDRDEMEYFHTSNSDSGSSSGSSGGIGCGTVFMIVMLLAFIFQSCGA